MAKIIDKKQRRRSICKICDSAIRISPIKITSNLVYLDNEYLRKITKTHAKDWQNHHKHLSKILRFPDYVGFRSSHKSIQLVKKIDGINILVAVHITRKAKKLSIRSFHEIPERTLNNRILNKELRNV